MNADRKSDKTCISLLFLSLQSRVWVDGVRNTPLFQKSQLLKFHWLFVRVYGGNKLYILKFSGNVYEILYINSKDIIRRHNYGYFVFFWSKMCFFLTKIVSSLETRGSFKETTIFGKWNILWKFELDLIIFLDFTGIGSLKNKEISVSGAKLFFEEYFCSITSSTKRNFLLLWYIS